MKNMLSSVPEFHIERALRVRKNTLRKRFLLLFFLLAAGVLDVCMLSGIAVRFRYESFNPSVVETNGFRNQCVSKDWFSYIDQVSHETGLDSGSVLTLLMYETSFRLDADVLKSRQGKLLTQRILTLYRDLSEKKPKELAYLTGRAEAVWSDLKYFPVPLSETNKRAGVTFENSWMFERNYGGYRGHEGTDIMADINKRGYYPVVSITDGVIERIGWLNQGGYRIGIRSPHGGYFYYAHLDSYADAFTEGTAVKAGQLLGYMGDSGYGEKEGTVGKFDVHLHLGIYIRTLDSPEMSVNPYWVLKSLEDRKLTYIY